MSEVWPSVPLGEVLNERNETLSIASSEARVIEKIGFKDGKIQLRADSKTKTKMILIRPGDFVLSGINAAKGAVAVYGEENTEPIAATIHYGAYIPKKDKVDVGFLWWLLRSNTFRELLDHHLPGGIKTELKANRLLPIPVPLPPLSEQRRIVGRLEHLASKLEEARGANTQAQAQTNALLQARVSKAVQDVELSGTLNDVLLEKPRNGWSAKCDNIESGIPVLTLSAVTGFHYNGKEHKRTSLPTNPNAHYWLEEGDLLITRSNSPELVGHVALYDGYPSRCIYPDLMMRLKIDSKKVSRRFVLWLMQSDPIRDYIRENAKGTSPSMKKINQQTVMSIPFPSELSLDEQNQIARSLDNLQLKVDSLKQLQAQTRGELDALLPSVLDKAFRGEL